MPSNGHLEDPAFLRQMVVEIHGGCSIRGKKQIV